MNVEIISYNIHYGQKIDGVSAWIAEKNPDAFCLQEFPESELGRFKKGYQEFFAASFNKKGRVFGELIGVRKGIKVETVYCVDLGKMPENPLLSSSRGRRSALVMNFRAPVGNLVLGNIHLEWQARSKFKLDQLRRVLKSMEDMKIDPKTPIVLTGDFNYSKVFSGTGLERFASENGFQSAVKFSTHRLFGLKHQVDYVFYKNCEIERARSERINFSDHKPILFTVIQSGG